MARTLRSLWLVKKTMFYQSIKDRKSVFYCFSPHYLIMKMKKPKPCITLWSNTPVIWEHERNEENTRPRLVFSHFRSLSIRKSVFVNISWFEVKNDHGSKFFNLSNWKEEAGKNQGFNGIPRYQCDALSIELWSHTLGARFIYVLGKRLECRRIDSDCVGETTSVWRRNDLDVGETTDIPSLIWPLFYVQEEGPTSSSASIIYSHNSQLSTTATDTKPGPSNRLS